MADSTQKIRRIRRLLTRASVLLAICVLSACATTAPSNIKLEKLPIRNYDFEKWIEVQTIRRDNEVKAAKHDEALSESIKKKHESIIVMSFSGGGSRAAALAHAVLEHLGDLSSQVAIISSTSGGSVTAGFMAAEGKDSLGELESRFLSVNHVPNLLPHLLPTLLTGENRSQLFARYLDKELFQYGPKFGDLASRWERDRPFVMLNASDMSSGFNFVFTQKTFGALCSNLDNYPLSEAIAASAAVPVATSPITLKNHWAGGCPNSKDTYDQDYDSTYLKRHNNLPAFISARYLFSLKHSFDGENQGSVANERHKRIEYIHLLDGGLSDNLATRALLQTFQGSTIGKLKAMGVKRILLIQVNAKSESLNNELDLSPNSPGIVQMAKTAVLNPIDVTTMLSAFVAGEYWAQLIGYESSKPTSKPDDLHFFPVEVDFDLIAREKRRLQERVKAIGTSWKLKENELLDIKTAAKHLLGTHPCFRDFLKDAQLSSALVPPSKGADSKCEFIPVQRILKDGDQTQVAVGPAPEGSIGSQKPTPPPPAKPAPKPAPKPKPVAEKVTLAADVLFDFDKAVLKNEGKSKLDDLATKVKAINLEVVIAIGHTDSVGADAYNQKLSVRRAESVKSYLVSKGVEPNRIYTEGKGEKQPVASNKTADGRHKNRRVEIEVIGTRK